MKRGNFKKKYISRKIKRQRKTMIPGVFSSTIYPGESRSQQVLVLFE
jgi:hypothetical protein